MKTTIAVLDKKGNNAATAVTKALKSSDMGFSASFGIASPTAVTIEKNVDALQKQKLESPTVVGYAFSSRSSNDVQQCIRSGDATFVFDGRIYASTSAVAVSKVIAKKMRQADRIKACEYLLGEVEGDFSFIIAEPERIIAGRDPVGVQPLYYGENRAFGALASNLKALRKLGIEKPQSFPPGHLALVSRRKGFKFKPVKTLSYPEPKPITLQKAAENLQKLLEYSVRKRVFGTKEVAVAFSGGLDSSVVAFMAKKFDVNVHLIHVSLEDQSETEDAEKAAEEMKLPLQVYLFGTEDVEKVVAKVVELIEEPNSVKTSIGVPFYWTAEKTAETGFKVLLAGQGADELFGGYKRYVNNYLSFGKERVQKAMFDDVVRLHENNIERDVKICNFHDVELRLPFASYQLIEFALSLPMELKIEKKADSIRKLILRKMAENIGLPASIAEKPKRAVQYSTGVMEVLRKIAKKQNETTKEYVQTLFLNQTTA